MSLYNLINGVNPLAIWLAPMLGHRLDHFARWRDIHLSDPDRPEYDDHIHVYTRIGGGNRDSYRKEIDEYRAMDAYVSDFDDDFDNTFATFVFRVPEKYAEELKMIKENRLSDLPDEYIATIKEMFPKVADTIDKLFEEVEKPDDDSA